jgi:hypothetical protein
MPMVECPQCHATQYAAGSYVGITRCSVCDSLLPVTKRQRDLATGQAPKLHRIAELTHLTDPHSTI